MYGPGPYGGRVCTAHPECLHSLCAAKLNLFLQMCKQNLHSFVVLIFFCTFALAFGCNSAPFGGVTQPLLR